MEPSETFVVRIYRRGQIAAGQLVGVVESVASGLVHRFGSFEELRAILERQRTGGKGRPHAGSGRKP